MQVHLAGLRCSVGLPAIHNAISALKVLPTLADAQFAALDSSLPQVVKGHGVAHAVASVARGAAFDVRHVKRQVDAIRDSLNAEIAAAKQAVEQADEYALHLRQLADFIDSGKLPSVPDFDPFMFANAQTLRNAKLLGDPTGICAQTVHALQTEHSMQVVQVAKCKALLRRRQATLSLAVLNQKAVLWKRIADSAASPGCIASLADQQFAKGQAHASAITAKAYKAAYEKTIYQGEARLPAVAAVAGYGTLRKASNGSYIFREVA